MSATKSPPPTASATRWKPSVTVAAVIERNGRFLLIEEAEEGRRVLNQPAGHWEPGETLVEACVRETLEESAHRFTPTALVGIYHWRHSSTETVYLRLAFCGECGGEVAGRALDPAILGTTWLSADELRAAGSARRRSPLVLRCVEDYLAGRRYPLEMLAHVIE